MCDGDQALCVTGLRAQKMTTEDFYSTATMLGHCGFSSGTADIKKKSGWSWVQGSDPPFQSFSHCLATVFWAHRDSAGEIYYGMGLNPFPLWLQH